MKTSVLVILVVPILICCNPYRQLRRSAKRTIADPTLQAAHVGVSIYDPLADKWLYNYQGAKYFVPASNTKLPTCYAAMKYLGDSLATFQYEVVDDEIHIRPSGDPTFLHPEYTDHPALEFLKKHSKIVLDISGWREQPLGMGWSWNDYSDDYMAERSVMPMYGNVVRFSGPLKQLSVVPAYFSKSIIADTVGSDGYYPSSVQRDLAANRFVVRGRSRNINNISTPFFTAQGSLLANILADTLKQEVVTGVDTLVRKTMRFHSRPLDSLLRPMMYNSDNFFAEQSLLMVSNQLLGFMNDARVIDAILKGPLKDLPQKPRWVDGSGLSRFNLFTPQDMVTILNKLRSEFGIERMKRILAPGNSGTLEGYYINDSAFIYAKTGTLTGVIALSGYLYTKRNRLLIFSVLVNNHLSSATEVRKTIERFILGIRNDY
jgi:D-alanyl-D-alanine carboxypeptidase/D-alanyl-D-alanine-endopeptidase (penicillin-binding protein 4)